MLIKKFKDLLIDDKGAVMALIAMGLVVIMGCAALVIDAGMLYAQRAKASNAIDAAVLAGVRELPAASSTDALSEANKYAKANGLDLINDNVRFNIVDEDGDGKYDSITGDADSDMDMFFARVLGINTSVVKAHAKAKAGKVGKLGKGTGIVPIGVTEDEIVYDKVMELKEGGGSGEQGWYGCLRLSCLTGDNGGGANEYEHYLTYGYDGAGTVSYGTLILEENGNMSGGTYDGVTYRINKCAEECDRECTFNSYDPDCPRVVIVPVGKMIDQKHFKVTSFAAFYLTGVMGQGNESIIKGRFLNYYEVPGAEIDDNIESFGVITRVLL